MTNLTYFYGIFTAIWEYFGMTIGLTWVLLTRDFSKQSCKPCPQTARASCKTWGGRSNLRPIFCRIGFVQPWVLFTWSNRVHYLPYRVAVLSHRWWVVIRLPVQSVVQGHDPFLILTNSIHARHLTFIAYRWVLFSVMTSRNRKEKEIGT